MTEKTKNRTDQIDDGKAYMPRSQSSASVGDILREARLARRVSLEDISLAINIRVAQLRAIEEGHIDALPGMTYALGFVRSYATHLGLDGADIVQKFKMEHGTVNARGPNLSFPEAPVEGPNPNFFVIGFAVVAAVLVMLFWAVFFSASDETEIELVQDIPPPSAVIAPPPQDAVLSSPINTASVQKNAHSQESDHQSIESGDDARKASLNAADASAADKKDAPETEVAASVSSTDVNAERATPVAVPKKRSADIDAKSVSREQTQKTINVRSRKGRVVLQAKASSWIEIKDAQGEVIHKAVLRKGQRYVVPDQQGAALTTSNAGGLRIYVDGKEVQSLGQKGEILRGVSMNPDSLKAVRTRTYRNKSGARR